MSPAQPGSDCMYIELFVAALFGPCETVRFARPNSLRTRTSLKAIDDFGEVEGFLELSNDYC
jgi:hypothetical protein